MFHNDRVWCVTRVESAEDLARRLTQTVWTGCTAFALGDYVWLNDATSPDRGQEYAVIKRTGRNGNPIQVESITFSWCDYDEALGYIEQTLRGEDDGNDLAREVSPRLQAPEEHGPCCHCA